MPSHMQVAVKLTSTNLSLLSRLIDHYNLASGCHTQINHIVRYHTNNEVYRNKMILCGKDQEKTGAHVVCSVSYTVTSCENINNIPPQHNRHGPSFSGRAFSALRWGRVSWLRSWICSGRSVMLDSPLATSVRNRRLFIVFPVCCLQLMRVGAPRTCAIFAATAHWM